MKLPTRLATILGTIYAALLAISTQVADISKPVHVAIAVVIVALATLIDPTEGKTSSTGSNTAAVPPYGLAATEAAPAATTAATQKSLP